MKKANKNLLKDFLKIARTIQQRHRQNPCEYQDEEGALVSFCSSYLNQIAKGGHYYRLPHLVFAEKILAFHGANSLYKLFVNKALNAREVMVLKYRHGSEMFERKPLVEIADILGYKTRERIRQIEAKALRKLLHPSRRKRGYHEREHEYLMNKFHEEREHIKNKRKVKIDGNI